MAFEIRIPRLGWSMEEGTFIGWKKRDGETVRAGESLFELEGEKAAQDIESVDEGILRIPPDAPAGGTVVAVGRVIGYLLAAGERAPWETAVPAAASGSASALASGVAASNAAPAAAPSVRRLARELNVDLERLAGANGGGRITADDVRQAAQRATTAPASAPTQAVTLASVAAPAGRNVGTNGAIRVTPRARRAAKRLGVNCDSIVGSGRGGRIRERDVLAAAGSLAAAGGGAAATFGGGNTATAEVLTLSNLRRTIGSRLMRSQTETVPVTLHTRVDASNLVSLREQFKTQGKAAGSDVVVPSYTDLVVKLCAAVLQQQPRFAARWQDDKLVVPASFDIGVAVDTDEGLMVPVVRGVERLKVAELSRVTSDLISRARSRQLRLDELQGGVFTVTNLGAFGIDGFTPVIHWPETTILGLGAIRREPTVVADDRIEPRWQMTLSLTFDHRATDGAPAARFLQTIRTALENPAAWLLV